MPVLAVASELFIGEETRRQMEQEKQKKAAQKADSDNESTVAQTKMAASEAGDVERLAADSGHDWRG